MRLGLSPKRVALGFRERTNRGGGEVVCKSCRCRMSWSVGGADALRPYVASDIHNGLHGRRITFIELFERQSVYCDVIQVVDGAYIPA